jgi:hypothetical protein
VASAPVAYNRVVTLDLQDHPQDRPLKELAREALAGVAPAVSELGRALAELRDALPGDQRADGERAFMNAFGNAVWAEARSRLS